MRRVAKGKDRIQVLDLFAGVGGLSYGFQHHPAFDLVAANEILPAMAEAYRLNHSSVEMFEGDIQHFGAEALERRGIRPDGIQILVGGPPCQAYSTVGKRLLDDPRGKLFQEYFRILSEVRPKIFIFENVKGLVSMGSGDLLPTIVSLFESLDYKVSWQVLNAADFGVPQTRERVIIVGTAQGIDFRFPEPTHAAPELVDSGRTQLGRWLTLADAIGDLEWIEAGEASIEYASNPQTDFQSTMRKGAPKLLMDHNAPRHNRNLIELMRFLPEGGSPNDLPEYLRPKSGFPNTYCRLWWDRPCTTVTRNLGTPSSSRCIHPFANRGLTTREGARVQCFPDSYRFAGSRSDRNLQIGNAVPTFLSRHLATSVHNAIK